MGGLQLIRTCGQSQLGMFMQLGTARLLLLLAIGEQYTLVGQDLMPSAMPYYHGSYVLLLTSICSESDVPRFRTCRGSNERRGMHSPIRRGQ